MGKSIDIYDAKHKQHLKLSFAQYMNGNTAIHLTTTNGEPWGVATVNLGDPINPDHVLIKDYSENEGMADMLIDNGIIEPEPVASYNTGWVTVHEYKLAPDTSAHEEAEYYAELNRGYAQDRI